MTHRLEPLLNPGSIALIGASGDAGRIGGMPLDLLTRFGYGGLIYPVNPKYQEVFGLRCWPDIESVPQGVDLAVLAIGAAEVTPMLRRCHARGVRAAIVYAAGFAEAGGDGARLQREMEDYAAQSGMIVAGPNCMGFANLNTQAHTAFASVFKTAPMQQEPGQVSLLTQSGNVCAAVYAIARRLGLPFSQFINTGNEACVDFSAYLEYLAQDPQTEIVLGYLEQLRDGPRFVQACRELQRRDKVLIALKAGATDKGAQAVRSHTSALAGDRRIYSAAFRQLDVIEAHDFAQMAQLAYLASLRHRSAGRRVAVLTMSGALGAILADRFVAAGLELPDLPAGLQQTLRGGIPDYGMVGNPVDVTGNVVNNPGFVRAALQALAISDAIDTVVVYAPGYMLDRMADALADVARAHPRLFAAIDTGAAQCRQSLRDAGVAVFDDLGLAVSALAPYLSWCAA
ncbi:acetate--CoA ligase family protein, partial [Bordetella petrii]|uniref:acetate--CoA ligase family protein n=1 Tax=Bordetella petrii TaxID=94624 RepID=UPI001E582270